MRLGKVYAVGVGPGSPKYVTEIVSDIIKRCDIIIGYRHALHTVRDILVGKETYSVTMADQEEIYQKVLKSLGGRSLVVLFTGDVNFSESEVVDRLIELFGDIEIVPGISSIQVAAAKARVPLDKSRVITMHVTTPIEDKKIELQQALRNGQSVVLVPRPWPKRPDKHFMPSEIAAYLRECGFDTGSLRVHVYESLTTDDETNFVGHVRDLEGREFSDLSVIVFNQTKLDSYMNYKWQWQN